MLRGFIWDIPILFFQHLLRSSKFKSVELCLQVPLRLEYGSYLPTFRNMVASESSDFDILEPSRRLSGRIRALLGFSRKGCVLYASGLELTFEANIPPSQMSIQ